MKLKLSEEVQVTESGDVAKSTIAPTRRKPTHQEKSEDKQEDSLPEEMAQGVQKVQQKKIFMKTVVFERIVDKVKFENVDKLTTTTLQEVVPQRRHQVVQDNHMSIKNHNTAVQARYKKPQEIATSQNVKEDRSALH